MPNHAATAVRWFEEVWNQGNEATIDEFFSPEGHCYGFPEPTSVIGREEYKATVRHFRSTFSSIHVTVDDTVTEGDKVAIRWTAQMRHTGDGLGFAPTDAPVTLTGISMMYMKDGFMTDGWNALDMTAVVARLSDLAAAQ